MKYEININQLKKDLIDYYGSAMTEGFPQAAMDVSKIEQATENELLSIASKLNINLKNYIVEKEEDVER